MALAVIIVGSLLTLVLVIHIFYKALHIHDHFHGWWCMKCVKKFGVRKALPFLFGLGTMWMKYGDKKNNKK